MKLIKPSVSRIVESDPFKKIEKVGRTCYKSEDKITEGSAKKFYKGLVARSHTAMVEHATFVFQTFSLDVYNSVLGCKYLNYTCDNGRYLISGNLRAFNNFGNSVLLHALHRIDPDLVYNNFNPNYLYGADNLSKYLEPVDVAELKDLTRNEFLNHFYMTFLFICDRGVSHEMVRHRPASWAQESTRYCNYVKAQFGGECTFIEPAQWDALPDHIKHSYVKSWESCESEYNYLINHGQTPQQARAVLPNALKTEVIMTANAGEYEHFFDLRSRGVTGAPHPDIKVVADMACTIYEAERAMILGV